MTYDEIAKLSEKLSYRDKLRLAQLLIQLARKEEEEQNPSERVLPNHSRSLNPDPIQYVAERIVKLHPTKKASLLNSIGAMFQFQGGISEDDKERIISELQKRRVIFIDKNGSISYPHEPQV